MSFTGKKTLLLSILLLGLLPLGLLRAEDKVKLRSQQRAVDAIINKESPKGIDFTSQENGITLTVDQAEIEWMAYEKIPQSEKVAEHLAEDVIVASELNRFIVDGKKIAGSLNENQKNYFDYYTALIYFKLGLADKSGKKDAFVGASKKFTEAFLKDNSKSRYAPNAQLLLADILLAQDKASEAQDIYESLSKSYAKGFFQVEAKVGLAKMSMATGKSDTALKICLELAEKGEASGELLDLLIRILIDETKDYAKALKIASSLQEKSRDVVVLQKAFELSGSASYWLKNPEKALEDLLRAELLYSSDARPFSAKGHMHAALVLQELMKQKADEYSEAEYRSKFQGHMSKLDKEERALVQSVAEEKKK